MSVAINNSEKRIQTLKAIIEQLHNGAPPHTVKQQLAEIVNEATAGEIGAMEQELIARGMKVEEIMAMCDLHHEVVIDILARSDRELPAGHPADTMRRENAALTLLIKSIRGVMAEISSSRLLQAEAVNKLKGTLNELMDLEKHYQRKENLFFTRLETHGIDGPSKVMWAKDDEVRGKLKAFVSAVNENAGNALALAKACTEQGEIALKAIEEMIAKENNILIPMCLDTFTEEDWAIIYRDSPQYGWCLTEPGRDYKPITTEQMPPTAEVPAAAGIDLETGILKLEELKAIFTGLPVDLTFVDAEDTVRFFSEGPDRVFPRSKAIIGRKVQHCHPPKSVNVVEQILGDFRAGRQSKAEFWINFRGKFVYIRYFALRDPAGKYLGCLEVTQDATALRALTGERRLLHYS